MGFTPEQIKGRIKSVAKQNNADARTLMRIYMMERFLERLAQSEYRDNFIIKGGILVTAMIGVAHRSTMDIDTSMKNLNLSAEDALRVVNQVKDIDLDDSVSFEVKITLAAGRIAEGLQDHLELGNMDSLRDWGYAKDYVECMWLIMQQDKPEDFVIATGVQHTVRDFTEKAFAANGITIRWEGTGVDEKGYDAAIGKMLVCVNPQWFRPTDVDNLWGDPTKAKTVLGWNPQKTSYEQLVEIMAKHDHERAKRERAMKSVL